MEFKQETMTVSQLNLFIKDIFGQIPILNNIRIKGEISNFKHHSSGHMYMSLKDSGGVVRAVMFKNAAMRLNFLPKDGLEVIAEGRVSVYERDGQYQLYINSMEEDGTGNLYKEFEKLKEKLQKEGLFNTKFKKPIPKFPKKIGVATAATGAAIRDILNILKRRYKAADICLYPVLVQGEGAAESIIRAIEYFNTSKSCDVIIIGRGGGSIEDLWAFNEETLARAIFKSEIPIISAVGHETDFTISDFVSDLRAPTPSAAAELAVPEGEELLDKFLGFELRLKASARRMIESKKLLLKLFSEKQVIKDPKLMLNEREIYIDHLSKMLQNAASVVLAKKEQTLGVLSSKLDGLSPLSTLNRGYSVLKSKEGSVLRSVKEINVGDEVKITMTDGEISAVATAKGE